MLKRISLVIIVLISWTLNDVNAATTKKTKKVTASTAVTAVVKVQKKKAAKATKAAPQKKKIAAAKPRKPKAPDPVQVKCLAKLGLGEAGDEPPLAQKAVLYVAAHYAKRVTFRSVCKESRDETRYSYLLFPKNLKTINETVAADGEAWAGVQTSAAEVLSSYPTPPLEELKHATTYLNIADSSPDGKGWIMMNTYRLELCDAPKEYKLGDHVFRIEKVYAWKVLGVVCPQRKPSLKLIARAAIKKVPSSTYR